MFRNYFKTAIRNLKKNKVFSAINIAGLSLGMAACLLILQYVSFHLSFDQFNRNAGDIYRVYNDRYQNGKLIQHGTITYSAIGKAMQDDYPEVINHVRVEPFGNCIISAADKKIGAQQVLGVDPSFFSMFSYPLIAGDPKSVLTNPYEAILSETTARKILNLHSHDYSSAFGKTIRVSDDSMPFKIVGICLDAPKNSHLHFDILVSYSTVYSPMNKSPYKEADYDFTQSDFWHYIQLRHGSDYKALQSKLEAFSQRHFHGNKVSGSVEKFYLQPLSRAHLYSDFEYEIGDTASATVVWGLLLIAFLIMAIAWVNYVNLSTAKSLERAREVGVRKVSGATRAQLIRQFLAESFLINLISVILALLLVIAIQPSFNQLLGQPLSLSYLFERGLSGYTLPVLLSFIFITGILVSGFYPAFILSSFRPALVLKGRFTGSAKGIFLRKALVIGQFAITVTLIIGSMIVYKQMNYVNSQNLGIQLSQVVVLNPPSLSSFDSSFIDHENSFSTELKKIPGVEGVANSWSVPGDEMGRSFNVRRPGQDASIHYTLRHTGISIGFLKLFGIHIIAGRDFSYTDFNPDFGKLHNLLLNESAVKLLGFVSPEAAIGNTILRAGRKWDVIGVVQDYHQKSLHYRIEPTQFLPAYSSNSSIFVRVSPGNLPSVVESIKKTYDAYFPGNLFDYYFLDEHFRELYANDQLFGKLSGIFSAFAIFIACIGLLGLALFATAQRTKEIGIRKVLGASVTGVIVLLSGDFIGLVFISILIACPLAWWIMEGWLQNFAYRTTMSWWIFGFAGFLSLTIALLTICIQALKAACANPVGSLRSE